MPTYDYECKSCAHRVEIFQSMAEDPLKTCPECKEDSLSRLIGGGLGVIFKGSGFYVNDSKKSNADSGDSSSTKKKESSAATGQASCGSPGCTSSKESA